MIQKSSWSCNKNIDTFSYSERHTVPHVFTCKFTYILSKFCYWCSVHTVSEKFQDAAFRLTCTVHTDLLRKRSVSKTLFKPEKFENADFLGDDITVNRVISLTEFSSNTNPKWPVIFAFSNSSDEVWMKNIWCVFRVKPPFSDSFDVKGIIKITDLIFALKLQCNQRKVTVWYKRNAAL